MGLGSALVDRGRILRQEARTVAGVPVKVEGTTVFDWVYGEYFDCRVTSPGAAKTEDASGGRERVDQTPSMIYDYYDDNDNPVDLHAQDSVEVTSETFGTRVWELTGEPTLYRKREDPICGEVTLTQLIDHSVILEPS